MEEDKLSTSLLPLAWIKLHPDHKAVKISSNGSCFYNSISVCLSGDESMAPQLRQAVSTELQINADKYVDHPHIELVADDLNLQGNDKLLLYQAMLSDDSVAQRMDLDNLTSGIKREGELTAGDRHWAGLLQTMALSTVLNSPIQSLYPDVDYQYRNLYNDTLLPLKHETINIECSKKHDLIILWTRDGNFDNTAGIMFMPNHVVAVIPETSMQTKSKRVSYEGKAQTGGTKKRQARMQDFFKKKQDAGPQTGSTSSTETGGSSGSTGFPEAGGQDVVSEAGARDTLPEAGGGDSFPEAGERDSYQGFPDTGARDAAPEAGLRDSFQGFSQGGHQEAVPGGSEAIPDAHAREAVLGSSTAAADFLPDKNSYDIANFVDKHLDENTLYNIITRVHKPGPRYKFKLSTYGNQQRSFQYSWLDKYKHLVYSQSKDAAYCLPCSLFSAGTERGALSSVPYTNWKKAKDKFEAHFHGKVHGAEKATGYKMHLVCLERMQNFKIKFEKGDELVLRMNRKNEERIKYNRLILSSVIATIKVCGMQGLPLQGHKQTFSAMKDQATNSGNFLELLQWRAEGGDTVLKKHLDTAAQNALYISKNIQNELIKLIGRKIVDGIVEDVNCGSSFFSVSADEVSDVSNHEQLAVCIRYIDKYGKIHEEFIALVDVTGKTRGEDLATAIKTVITETTLPLNKLRGQCYDGAGNMAGKEKGVGPRLSREYPKAQHFWCASHKINLVIVASCKLPAIRNMMDSTDQCVRYFNNSPKREKCLRDIIDEARPGDDRTGTKLKELCHTRWVERHVAFDRFLELHEYVVMALETISMSNEYNAASRAEAATLLTCITKFDFVFVLVVTARLLAYLKPLSVNLQKRNLDLDKAFTAIETVKETLSEIRHADHIEESHHVWYEEAVRVASKVNVDPVMPRIIRRQTLRANNPAQNIEEHFRRNVTVPYLDGLLSELRDRFKEEHKRALAGMILMPKQILNCVQLPIADLQQFNDDLPSPDDLPAEVHLWKNFWQIQVQPEQPDLTIEEVLQTCLEQEMFPNIVVILQLMAVLPVTSAEPERVFSQLKLVKTYLRNGMTEARLNGLALMKVHRKRTMTLDKEQIINAFANLNPRRLTLTNILLDE